MGNGLALGVVRDDCFARSGRSRSDSKSDTVTSGETDAAKVVGIVWIPFVPCIIGCFASAIGEINTGLQDCYQMLADEILQHEGHVQSDLPEPQVSPSMPTQADAEDPELESLLSFGTMKVPVTEVIPELMMTAPAQLEEY